MLHPGNLSYATLELTDVVAFVGEPFAIEDVIYALRELLPVTNIGTTNMKFIGKRRSAAADCQIFNSVLSHFASERRPVVGSPGKLFVENCITEARLAKSVAVVEHVFASLVFVHKGIFHHQCIPSLGGAFDTDVLVLADPIDV